MKEELTDTSVSFAQEMAELTCELSRTCNEKEHYFASLYNLTPAEFKCLRLFTNSTQISIKEIAHRMKITPGRITHILTSLENKQFILRKLDAVDKRNVIVHLTNKSKPFIKNLNMNHVKLHEEILGKIDSDMHLTILKAMREVIKALKQWSAERSIK